MGLIWIEDNSSITVKVRVVTGPSDSKYTQHSSDYGAFIEDIGMDLLNQIRSLDSD